MRAAAARGGDGAWAHAERCDVEDECRMSVRVPRHAAARLASCLSKAGGRAREQSARARDERYAIRSCAVLQMLFRECFLCKVRVRFDARAKRARPITFAQANPRDAERLPAAAARRHGPCGWRTEWPRVGRWPRRQPLRARTLTSFEALSPARREPCRCAVVRGGERLHLRHVRSQRLLTTRPHSGSVVEPNNLRVELSSEEDGTGQAVFVPLPIDPARSEAPLQPDEQLLEIGWAPVAAVKQLLHASVALLPTASAAELVRELNCAAAAGSRWRLRLYARRAARAFAARAFAARAVAGRAVRRCMSSSSRRRLLVPGEAGMS